MRRVAVVAAGFLAALAVGLAAAPAGAEGGRGTFTLFAAGDYAFPAGKYDAVLDRTGPAFLDAVRPLLKQAQARFLNLEAPVTERPFAMDKEYQYRMPPHRLGWALDAGFNLVSVANNHMGDTGEAGVADTEAALAARGAAVAWAGAGSHPEGADLALADGTVVRLIALSCTRYPLVSKPGPWVAREIAAARKAGKVVVVSAHCGTEYRHEPDPGVVALYRGFVDAGADLVIGHHPHVVQGVEVRRHGVILYSLGNFALASMTARHRRTGARMYGLVALADFAGGRLERVRLVPTWASNNESLEVGGARLAPTPFRPLPATGAFGRRVLDEVAAFSSGIDGNRTRIALDGDVGVVEVGAR